VFCRWDSHPLEWQLSSLHQTVNEQTRFITNVKIGNAGKTFAKQVLSQYVLLIPRNTESASFDYSRPDTNEIIGMMAPNSSSVSIFQVTTLADQPLGRFFKKEEIDDLLAGRRYLVMYSRGSYWDVFGKQHWFHHGNWRSYFQASTYAASNCTLYNNMGDGPLPEK